MKKLIAASIAIAMLGAVSVRAADTEAIYKKDCAKCHGEDGKGQTMMGKKLGVKDYTDAAVQAKLKDEEMVKAIKDGVKEDGKTKMKGFAATLSDAEVKALVKHIRDFKK